MEGSTIQIHVDNAVNDDEIQKKELLKFSTRSPQ